MNQLPEAVLTEFQKGNFVVKRSPRRFSQVDPDQAMEWINSTGKRGGGIVGITKTTSALCRWTLSFNLRSHIAEQTHQLYRLSHGGTDHHNEATKSRQKRDNDDENDLLTTLLGYSVFSPVSHPDTLQNIATKDLATQPIQDSLLHAKELGMNEVEGFAQDRLVTAEGFDKPAVSIHDPLRRNNAPTFATLYEVAKQTKEKDKKEVLKADRNILRRLITAYEASRPVDLPSILRHELLPVPISLAEMNGNLRSGNKAVLAEVITEGIDCPEVIKLHDTSSCLIDGQALVVVLGKPDGAVTFGDLADAYVNAVLKAGAKYHRIDIVFDRYRKATIKGTTRTRRSKGARPIRRVVEGRDVPLPKNWQNFLSLADNKADLAHFLSEQLYLQAPADKEILVAGGFKDELMVKSSKDTTDVTPFKSTHEEADTRLVLHAINSQFNTVVVVSRDTDVLLLLVYHFQRMGCEQLWMMSGTSKKRRYIPIGLVFNNLPSGSVSTLLAFHALTGCDTTSYIADHTKRTAWRVFKEHHALLNELGVGDLTKEKIMSSEAFMCRMYNVQRTDSVDTARHLLFPKTAKPEAMPPTSDAFRFHLMRVHYQAMVWINAFCPQPELPVPTEMEWRLCEAGWELILMSLCAIPASCLEMVACGCRTQCQTRRCKCRKSGLVCTSVCKCHQNSDDPCMNTA
jgi:hypothetical protein